jgi:prevent-host-death family protein
MATTAIYAPNALKYTADMTDNPADLESDLPINKARNQLAGVIAKARYIGGVTYLTNHGKRVAAVVPVEVAEAYEAQRRASSESAGD